MSLKLYLDDCANSSLLAELLRTAGHQVTRPTDVNMSGESDLSHFCFAIMSDLITVTKNPADFQALHEEEDGDHPGIFAVYQDNDLTRDMSDAEIVKAIERVLQAASSGGQPIRGEFHILNNWRG